MTKEQESMSILHEKVFDPVLVMFIKDSGIANGQSDHLYDTVST